MTPTDRKELDAFDLGIVANNGKMAMDADALDFRQKFCECDYEVGAVPCHYCAIDHGLRLGKRAKAALDVAVKALGAIKAGALREIKTPYVYDTRLTATYALTEIQAILKCDRLAEKGEK